MASLAATCGLCGVVLTPLNSSFGCFRGSRIHYWRQEASSEKGRRNVGIAPAQAAKGDVDKQKNDENKTSLFTTITDALDFAQTRSEKDAELIADAREATKSGEKMSREQYAALRRKIGGTYKDFFKDSVEVIGDYVDDGWVDKKCRVCKKDTSKDPRTKDNLGRYAHVACLEKETSGNFFTRLFNR